MEPQTLHLSDLPVENLGLHGKIVRARGFWHPLSSNEGVLSNELDLKSCCIRAPAKIAQQIFVKNAPFTLTPKRAITLEGRFNIEPRYDENGQIVQLYVLEEAKEVEKEEEGLSSIHVGAVWAVFLLILLFPLFFSRLFIKRQS